MNFVHLKSKVANRGEAPDSFLCSLLCWGSHADDELFAPNREFDVYSSVYSTLGPWEGKFHRRCAMLEVLRVLGGFESSWNWSEGRDTTNKSSDKPETTEAGLWQVSANSMGFGQDLVDLVKNKTGTTDALVFQSAMKRDHNLAMEYITRLLRHTVKHNGPVLRHEIDPFLSRASVSEIGYFL